MKNESKPYKDWPRIPRDYAVSCTPRNKGMVRRTIRGFLFYMAAVAGVFVFCAVLFLLLLLVSGA
jgi:hypothetical protein